MKIELMKDCELLVTNRAILRETFPMEPALMSLAAAAVLTGKGLAADPAKLKACNTILKKHTGAFSGFRGNVKLPLICAMSVAPDAEGYLARVQSAYDSMKQSFWERAEYRVLAAMTICDHISASDFEAYALRTEELYSRMKQEHRWLTSDEDIPFAALLAVSGLDLDKLITEMEEDYRLLRSHFHDNNAVQSLSHVLALSSLPAEEKCNRVNALFAALKDCGHKFGTGYELAVLGSLATLDMPADSLAEKIAEVDDFLKDQKGFGSFSLGSKERRMYAAQLILNHCGQNSDGVALGSMLALTVQIEVCMLICIASCTATATAATH